MSIFSKLARIFGSDNKNIEMVLVQGGTFQMGDLESFAPVHTVTLSDFYIGKYQVTQKEYEKIIGSNPSYFKGERNPVERVSWYDATKFCNRLSELEGLEKCYSGTGSKITCNFKTKGYRLPSEAEWEYAARGGNKSMGFKYSGSDDIDEVAWQSGDDLGSLKLTKPVGTKHPNELGIYDMSGNVEEWCWDWYVDDYLKSEQNDNPTCSITGSCRVFRGGDWRTDANLCRVTRRYDAPPYDSYGYVGFRLSRTP